MSPGCAITWGLLVLLFWLGVIAMVAHFVLKFW